MSKFSYEEKLEAVLRVVNNETSFKQSAKILGTNSEYLRRLIKKYNEFGPEGLLMKSGSYTGDFKLSVIEYMHENNLSLFETATKFGIPNGATIGIWERRYFEEGPQALFVERRGRAKKMNMKNIKPPKPNMDKKVEEDLIAEVQRLRMENEYLKKLNALVQKRINQENGK